MKHRSVVIFTSKNNILVIKRKRSNIEYYCFPGGRIEGNESVESAAKREIYEELSHEIQGNINCILTLNRIDLNEKSTYFHQEVDLFEPKLNTSAPELSKINSDYIFEPVWIDYAQIFNINLFPIEIKKILTETHPSMITNEILL